jgi:hypothetical protein
MCYHLDYLLLLLSGALDAMMLAVKRAFAIDMDDRRVGFWSKKFRKQLAAKAPGVLGLISAEPAEALHDLLAEPRNSIHALHLQTIGYEENGGPAMVLVKMGDRIGNAVTQATRHHGGPRRWGLISFPDFPFEPYAYSNALVESCFRLIQDVFETTERQLCTDISDGGTAPRGSLVSQEALRRIALLG